MKKDDRAAFEALRAQLKSAGCRVTALDEAIAEESGDAGGRWPTQADIRLSELASTCPPIIVFQIRKKKQYTFENAYFAWVRKYVGSTTFEMCNEEITAKCNMRGLKCIVRQCSHKTRRRSILLPQIVVRGS